MFNSNGISKRVRGGLMAIAIAGSGMLVTAGPASAHGSAPRCQCVDYIKHSYDINGSTGNAKDMGRSLVNNYGFRKVSAPVVGAIVVFQPSFGQVNPTYGHVGRVIGVSDSGGSWRITVRSANNGGSQTVLDCNNMNDKAYSAAKSSGSIAYYRR